MFTAPPRPVECTAGGGREREREWVMFPIPPRPEETGAPSCAAVYSRMTSCSAASAPGAGAGPREGERKLPAPPRPVENTAAGAWAG